MLVKHLHHDVSQHTSLFVFLVFPKRLQLLCSDLTRVTQGDGRVSKDMQEAQLLVPRCPGAGTFSRCHTSWKSFLLFSVFRNVIHRYQSVPYSAHRSVDAIVCHRVLQTTRLEAVSTLTPLFQTTLHNKA